MPDTTERTEALEYLKSLCQQKYSEEISREQSLISQAGNMQTVFAVSTAAFYMLLPVIIENRGVLSLAYMFFFTSLISFFLIASFVIATVSQKRTKIALMPNIQELKSNIDAAKGSLKTKDDILEDYILLLESVFKPSK